MTKEQITECIRQLRDRLHRGEITREQFLELREPLKAEMAKQMFLSH